MALAMKSTDSSNDNTRPAPVPVKTGANMARMILTGGGHGDWTINLKETETAFARDPHALAKKHPGIMNEHGQPELPCLAVKPSFNIIEKNGIEGLSSQQAWELTGAFYGMDLSQTSSDAKTYPDYVYAMHAFVGKFKHSLSVHAGKRTNERLEYCSASDGEESVEREERETVTKVKNRSGEGSSRSQ